MRTRFNAVKGAFIRAWNEHYEVSEMLCNVKLRIIFYWRPNEKEAVDHVPHFTLREKGFRRFCFNEG
ncbi:MAG TPA: hypothetical protein DEP42_03880 [Ruminococcaceae bacterium]|nr:hypothetical protein [Oscillospiraceae bacterium]